MYRISRRLFSSLLLVTTFLVAALSGSPAVHAQMTGTVCIEPSGTSGCTTPPVTIGGLGVTVGSSIVVAINIQSSDAINGVRIFVKTDNTILNPQKADLANTVLLQPVLPLANCVNGAGTGCSLTAGDGPGVVDVGVVSIGGLNIPPVTGGLFEITYNVMTSTPGTPVSFLTGACSNGSSVSGLCVTVTNGGGTAALETAQTATFFNQPAPPDFNLSVSPTSGTVVQGSTTQTVLTTTVVSGTPGSVSFTTSTLPSGLTATFSPTSCTPPCSPTLTFTATATAMTGAIIVTVTGTASGIPAKTATYSLTVQQAPRDFALAASPSSLTLIQGGAAVTSLLTVSGTNGFTDTINLVQVETPAGGPTVLLSPTSLILSATTSSASSSLSISAGSSTLLGQYTITVTATGATTGKSKVATVFATVVAPSQSANFVISTNPTSLFIQPGNTGRVVIVLRSLNGFAGPVNLASIVSPEGPLSFLSRTSIVLTAGGFWALTLSVSTTMSTIPGSYTVVVTATSGSISHSALVSVTVL